MVVASPAVAEVLGSVVTVAAVAAPLAADMTTDWGDCDTRCGHRQDKDALVKRPQRRRLSAVVEYRANMRECE